MFARIVTSALFAGFCAGLIAAALQLMFVQPVLLHAELYETGALVHFGAGEPTAAEVVSGGFDLTRNALSALFTTLVYTGYALILVSVMAVAARQGAVISPRAGIIWGLAGFVTVHFAPAFGLPPELPGASTADLGARQAWWFGCVAATGVGLWMLAFGRGWAAWGAAVILLLAPHLLGAPEPASFHGPTPPELGSLFAARALGVGMAAWVLLGLFAGHFWQRELVERPAEA